MNRLGVGGCPLLGDGAVRMVARRLPNIERMVMHGLPLLSFDAARDFVAACPRLTLVHLDQWDAAMFRPRWRHELQAAVRAVNPTRTLTFDL
jgi:hypothetical protein